MSGISIYISPEDIHVYCPFRTKGWGNRHEHDERKPDDWPCYGVDEPTLQSVLDWLIKRALGEGTE